MHLEYDEKGAGQRLDEHTLQIVKSENQEHPKSIDTNVENDCAGCRKTKGSTNCGLTSDILGRQVMKSWATTQTVTALSRMLRVSWSHPKHV